MTGITWGRRLIRARRAGPGAYTLLGGAEREAVKRAYVKALRILVKKGYPGRRPHEAPAEYLTALAALGHPIPDVFTRISRQATSALYDPRPLGPDAGRQAASVLDSLRSTPKRS